MLAALNAVSKELITVSNLTYVNAETVCELLRRLAATHLNIPITVVLDNARYQRCKLVQELAQQLSIELLFLPSYSPNLNLKVPCNAGIERFWKFVKKQCLYSRYYPDAASFQQAILTCIDEAPSKHKAELERLLTLNFQTFKDVPILGQTPQNSQETQVEVLAMAA